MTERERKLVEAARDIARSIEISRLFGKSMPPTLGQQDRFLAALAAYDTPPTDESDASLGMKERDLG